LYLLGLVGNGGPYNYRPPPPAPSLGSQRGFKSSPKGSREPAKEAVVGRQTGWQSRPTFLFLPRMGRGRGPGPEFLPWPQAPRRSPLRPPPAVPTQTEFHQSRRLHRSALRAPTLRAPQPLAQPPPLGKTKPGGGGGSGLPERFRLRSQPRQP
jgi:hypothetical protein